jgi:hypothetical protein
VLQAHACTRDARNMQIREANRCNHNVYVRLYTSRTGYRVCTHVGPCQRNGSRTFWNLGQMHARHGVACRVSPKHSRSPSLWCIIRQIHMLIAWQRTRMCMTKYTYAYWVCFTTCNGTPSCWVHMSWIAGEGCQLISASDEHNHRIHVRLTNI